MGSRRQRIAETTTLRRGDFARLVYRLGRQRATGILEVMPSFGRTELLVLRRGDLISANDESPGQTTRRLERIASFNAATANFDGGVSAHPPGTKAFRLSQWARQHIERQIDSGLAKRLVGELAGARLIVRRELVPESRDCDDTDQRILDAMSKPRRLDQIWPLARTPRFRLLTFIHFLRCIGALREVGVAANTSVEPEHLAAHRVLGVDAAADGHDVKRAYRRLARALHPDLHPNVSDVRRRALERKLADVNSAYRSLLGQEG
jgi:DnaJ-domain-containing protein 1